MVPALGIDIGRVIIDGPADSRRDTGFFHGDEAAMLATPEMPGAFDTIRRLVDRFDGRVWLVSKCGRRAEKRAHCVALGLTHFVDDHPDVHAAIRGAVRHQYFFGPQREPVPDYGEAAPTWADVERLVSATLPLVGEQ
ncbi:MAG: hypothetical protein AUG44_18770 [Actinobacteria bacterium 13_1_20CM_3_71_11]|nr:MAG: hypothetical protein AUG44_18770 [Actinobacteria bacterium 13_1_20CM_3_71_11]